jgi:hypothetical protein
LAMKLFNRFLFFPLSIAISNYCYHTVRHNFALYSCSHRLYY